MTTFKILVGSYTDSVYTLEFDSAPSGTPSLKYLTEVNVGSNPSWIEPHPSDRSLIFAALEQSPAGQIVVVKYDKDGNGQKIEEATCPNSGGADPCTLLVTEDTLLIGNYSGSTLATVPISTRPPYTQPDRLWTFSFPFEPGKPGRNPVRQEKAHPHQVVFNPLSDDTELLVPDLGSDTVWQLAKAPHGHWDIRGSIDSKIGGGPRHIAIHGNMMYVLLELTLELAVYKFHSVPHTVTHLTTVSTLKQSPTPVQMTAAEILIPKPNCSFPKTYIYTSNRDDPHPEGDTIAIFSLEKGEEHPELVTELRTGLRHVRGMAFGGEHDRWLIVGGVGNTLGGVGVKVYERVQEGRQLRLVATLDDAVGSKLKPTCFLWL